MRRVWRNRPQPLRETAINGFSLIEVVLTLVLAGLAIAVLAGAFSQSMYLQKVLDGRTVAVILGKSKLAELELGCETASYGDFSEPYHQFHWKASQENLKGDLKIYLTVEWGDTGAARSHKKTFEGWLIRR